MLDIVFIMLIFFIVTTTFARESGITVNRPMAATAEQKNKGTNIFVGLRKNGEVWIDKRLIDLRAVRPNIERLHVENPEGAVIIQADRDTKTGVLVEVMDQVRMAGVKNISIAARRE